MKMEFIKNLKESIKIYVETRTIDKKENALLYAIVTNDLAEAWRLTHKDDAHCLTSIMNYCLHEIPAIARGSQERVDNWMKHEEILPTQVEDTEVIKMMRAIHGMNKEMGLAAMQLPLSWPMTAAEMSVEMSREYWIPFENYGTWPAFLFL